MKVISISFLMLIPISGFTIDFNRCVDSNGIAHFTNVTPDQSNNNCKQTSFYDLQLNQDYERINQTFIAIQEQPEVINEETTIISEQSDTNVDDLMDSDKALDRLLDNSRQAPPNVATDLFHNRSDAIGTIMDNDN